MSSKSYLPKTSEAMGGVRFRERVQAVVAGHVRGTAAPLKVRNISEASRFMLGKRLSPWSRSRAKRAFDCACVLATMPLLAPMMLAVGLAVRLTSRGPVLFLQKRAGCNGRHFTILKFRTMIHRADGTHQPVTTSGNQLFTPVGPFLRRWKLDELPQLINVLAGHMSLVGPRPKLAVHAISSLPCRPGITGAATTAFAYEESILDRLPKQHLDGFYHSVVLPAKLRLDAEYMKEATFRSDLELIVQSVLRRWDNAFIEGLLADWAARYSDGLLQGQAAVDEILCVHPQLITQQMVAQMDQVDRLPAQGEMRAV